MTVSRARRAGRALRIAAALARTERVPFLRALGLQLWHALRERSSRAVGGRWVPRGELDECSETAPSEPPRRLIELFQLAADANIVMLRCLPRALALGAFLRCYGYESRLVLGVRRTPDGLEGHAWRQCGSRILDCSVGFARRFEILSPAYREGSDERFEGKSGHRTRQEAL
jgi:hypothetical protein